MRTVWNLLERALGTLLILPIRGYQLLISPLFGPTCRFYPSCSAYAVTAIRTRGPFVGLALTGWRLLRCNPWNHGGVDDVPPRGSWRAPPEQSSFSSRS